MSLHDEYKQWLEENSDDPVATLVNCVDNIPRFLMDKYSITDTNSLGAKQLLDKLDRSTDVQVDYGAELRCERDKWFSERKELLDMIDGLKRNLSVYEAKWSVVEMIFNKH